MQELIYLYNWFLQIKTTAKLEAAFTFFSNTGPENFKLNEFEEACGVGMEIYSSLLMLSGFL